MDNGRLGVVFVEIDLDKTKFEKQQQGLLSDIKKVGAEVEGSLQKSFQNLGVKTDNIYQLMADKAIKSYERISQAAGISANEQYRAQASMVSKINALNQEMNKNSLYETLGIRSVAAIEAQKEAVIRSFNTISQHAQKGSQDWINIERAKNDQLKKLNAEMVGSHEMSLASMTRAVLRLYAAYYILSTAVSAIITPIKESMNYLSTIETATLGIAASFVTGGKFIDQTSGKALDAEHALVAAQNQSKELLKELQFENLKTIATLDQLIIAYQNTLPVALAKGFNVKQVKDFTVAMVQAAGAIGLPMEQLAEETRSMLTGSINPRNSRIATVLGLRNEDLKQYQGNAQALFDFLMDKLSAYKLAGVEAQNTWAGLWSNMKDIGLQFLGNAFNPLFESIKYQLKETIDKIVTLDEKTRTIKWNPDFLTTIENIKSMVVSAIADMYLLGMAIDKVGGLATTLKKGLFAFGNAIGTESGKKGYQEAIDWNKELEESYKASDRALTDLAMREQGFKRSLEGTPGAISTTTSSEYKQVLWYIKEINKESTNYVTNPPNDHMKVSAKEHSDILKTMREDNKHYYEDAINQAKEAEKRSQQAGQSELITIQQLNDARFKALDERKTRQEAIAYEEVRIESEANAAKTGADRTSFDSSAVLAAKLHSIELDYITDANKAEAESGIKREEYYKKNAEVTAQFYHTIDQYSDESLASQIEALKKKYIESQRWTTADAAGRLLIETAEAAAELKLKQDNELAKSKIKTSQIEVTEGPYSEAYKAAMESQIKQEADLEEVKAKSANKEFNRQKWLTNKLTEELAQRLEAQATYYLAIGGMEDKANAAALAAIELRKKMDTTTYGDAGAASAKAAQDKIKMEQDILSAIGQRYDTEHKFQKDSITNSIKVTDNAMALMDKESKEYQAMQAIKKVLMLAEIAMETQKNISLLAFMMAQNAAYAAAMAKKAAGIALSATEAVLTQGEGDPYSAFARMAAMAAIVAGLLSAVGVVWGGGSSTASASVSGSAAVQGSSGVLGAASGVGSKSIENSLALMQDTYDMEYTKLTGIYNEMKQLNSNITSLFTSIIRAGGLTGITVDSSVQLSSQASAFHNIADSIFIDPLGRYLTDIMTDFTTAVFGGATQSWVTAAGLAVGAATVQSILDGASIQAQQFTLVTTSVSGGMFGNDSQSQNWIYSALDQQVMDALNKVYYNMSRTLVMIAEGLGQDVTDTLNYVFSAHNIDLSGMTTEEANAYLNAAFSNMMDQAVYDLFGDILTQYQKVDEGLMETAIRIITDKEIIMSMLEMTNQAFDGDTESAIALSEALITLAGGLDALTEAAGTYYDKFFTDAEKQIALQKQLSDAFQYINDASAVVDPATGLSENQLALVLPATRDEFKDLVEGLDLTTESGQAAYVALMQLSAAADQYYSSIEASQKILEDYNAYYNETMGNTSSIGNAIDDIVKNYEAAIAAAVALGQTDEELLAIQQQAADMLAQTYDDWVQSINDYYNQQMGNNSDLQNSINSVTQYYDEQMKAADALGATTEQLAVLQQQQQDIIDHLINEWVNSEIDYYNQLMGLNSDLGTTLDNITKHYEDAINAAEQAGMSEAELAAIRQAEANALANAEADYWQSAIDYYNDIMGNTTALERQINSINAAFEEYIKSAAAAGLSTEELAAAQAEAIQHVWDVWMYSLVVPFIDIAASMVSWAQGQTGASTFEQANTAYEIKLAMIASSSDDAQTQFENTVKALQDFFTTVISGLEQTYEALQGVKTTLAQDIENIQTTAMSPTEQAAFYADRAVEGYKGLANLLDEDIPAAVEKVRSDVLKYYDLEKQAIQDKYNTEIDAIKEKNGVELQNIKAVRDKLIALTYSAYNLALPTAKAVSASYDYGTMFAAAQTGDADSVSKYLSFVDTYLKSSQDAYKSSQQYQDIYSKVMSDIASLDTMPGASIESLTETQNQLIDEQTKAMKAELAELDDSIIGALNILNETIDARIQTTANDLATAFNLLMQVIAAGFPASASSEQPGDTAGYNPALTTTEISAFLADSNSIFTDSVVTTNELLMLGMTTQYNQMESLIQAVNTMSSYLYWIEKANWDLNHALSVQGYSEGGIASGPETGYVATLHGTELVVSPKNSVGVRMSDGGAGFNDPEIKMLLKTLVVQSSKKQNVTLTIDGKTVTGVMEAVADRLDQNRYDKKIKHRNHL